MMRRCQLLAVAWLCLSFTGIAGVWALPAAVRPPAPASAAAPTSAPAAAADNSTIQAASRMPPFYFTPPRTLIPAGMQYEDVIQRPFLYWRAWVNQSLPLHRVMGFLLFVLSGLQVLLGPTLLRAKEYYETKSMRCLGIGVLFSVFGVAAVGSLARMGLYAPIAIVLLAIIQGATLLGLTIAALSLGDSVLSIFAAEKLLKKPWLKNFVALWTGAILLALLVLVPGFGPVPRIGNRILALIAVAGAGALCLLIRQRHEPDR